MSKYLYKVIYINHSEVFEIYAKSVELNGLNGFVAIKKLSFTDCSELVVDPVAEKLQLEFGNVVETNIPISSIIRIDKVMEQGSLKIVDLKTYKQSK